MYLMLRFLRLPIVILLRFIMIGSILGMFMVTALPVLPAGTNLKLWFFVALAFAVGSWVLVIKYDEILNRLAKEHYRER